MVQILVVLPDSCARRAAFPRGLSLPSRTSASNCASQVSASRAKIHSRNSANSTVESSPISTSICSIFRNANLLLLTDSIIPLKWSRPPNTLKQGRDDRREDFDNCIWVRSRSLSPQPLSQWAQRPPNPCQLTVGAPSGNMSYTIVWSRWWQNRELHRSRRKTGTAQRGYLILGNQNETSTYSR